MSQPIHKLCLIGFAGALLAAPAVACGPFFPNQLLFNSGESVIWAPVANFRREIERLVTPTTADRAVLPTEKSDVFEQSAAIDIAELNEALVLQKMPEAGRLPLIARYAAARETETKYAHDAANNDPSGRPRPVFPKIAVPAGLPMEFDLYGALSFHAGEIEEARAQWQKLLELPPDQRRYRGVWAQFMIGKSYLATNAARAIAAFQSVRERVKAGDRDPLGLAPSSLGWEARAQLDQKHFSPAIELYLDQHAGGDPTAARSLAIVCEKVFLDADSNAINLRRIAANAKSARVITAYLLARGGPFREEPKPESRSNWLSAVEASGVAEVVGADRLAWAAYQSGEMSAAQRWVDKSAADSAIAQWVKAKLLLRAGKIDAAANALAKAARAFPQNERWADVEGDYLPLEYTNPGLSPHNRTVAELGALELSRGQYVDSLYHLLIAGWWLDAAYIAERVLTADELITFVDEHCPQGTHPELRHLLARRLTRVGRWKEASPYFPVKLQPRLDVYISAIRQGHSSKRSDAERAEAFWMAATVARNEGMDLLATELAPDSFAEGGSYPGSDVLEARQAAKGALLPPTPDEILRDGKSRPAPYKRFHYRYIAADHAWAAAELMPDETDVLAARLCEAGGWLKAIDPKAADRFYKSLVTRCGTTSLGREARRKKWFPEMKH